MQSSPQVPAGRRRPRWVIVTAVSAAGVAVLLGAAYLLVPVVAAPYVRSAIERGVQGRIAGSVRVQEVSLSWGGPTRLGGVELLDDRGVRVARLDAVAEPGIWRVLTAPQDLGVVSLTLTGDLRGERDAEGRLSTNLQRALATPAGGGRGTASGGGAGAGEAGRIDPRLRLSLAVASPSITYRETDASGATLLAVTINDLKVDATLTGGGGAGASLTLGVQAGVTSAPSGAPGSVSLQAQVTGLSDADGRPTPERARVPRATLEVSQVPTALLEALALLDGALQRTLGDVLEVRAQASRDAGVTDVALLMLGTRAGSSGPESEVSGEVRLEGRRLSARSPITLRLASLEGARALPAVRAALEGAGWTPGTLPSVRATLGALALTLPESGAPDLRGATVEAEVQLGASDGRLRVDGRSYAYRLEPSVLSLSAVDLARGVALRARTRAEVDGAPAGAVEIDLAATGLLDDRGRPRAVPGGLSGVVSVHGLSADLLAALAPGGAGGAGVFDARRDLGSPVDLVLRAEGRDGATLVDLTLESANIRGAGALRLSEERLESQRDLALSVRQAGPLLEALVGGLEVRRVGGGDAPDLALRVGGVSVPLEGGAPRLRDAAFDGELRTGALEVGLPRAEGGVERVTLQGAEVRVVARPATPLQVIADGGLGSSGRTARLRADLRVRGLFPDASGTPELPVLGARRVVGSLALTGLPTDLGGITLTPAPNAAHRGEPVRLSDLLGPTADAQAVFGSEGRSQGVSIALRSERADLTGSATLRPGTLEAGAWEAAVRLRAEDDRTLAVLAGLDPDDPRRPRLAEGGTLRVRLSGATLPVRTDAPAIDRDRLAAAGGAPLEATLDRLTLQARPPGHPDGAWAVGVRELTAGAAVSLRWLLAGEGPVLAAPAEVRAELRQGPTPGAMSPAGALSGRGALEADGTLSAGLTLRDAPTPMLEALLAQPDLLVGALGPGATISLEGVRRADATGEVKVDLSAERLRSGTIEVRISGAGARLAQPVTMSWRPDPAWVNRRWLGGGDRGGPALRVAELPLEITIEEARVGPFWTSTAQRPVGPLAPGAFGLRARAGAERITLHRPGPGGPQEITLTAPSVVVTSEESAAGAALRLRARVDSISDGPRGTTEPTTLEARLAGLAGPDGVPTPDRAELDLSARTGRIPTDLLDLLAAMEGRLTRLVGPGVEATITAERFSSRGGTLRAEVNGDNARLRVGGPVVDGVIDTGAPGGTPLELSVDEFSFQQTSTLDLVFIRFTPFFASATRARPDPSRGERPSLITSTNLRLPAPGSGIDRLDGDLTIDLGRIQYTFGEFFGELLDRSILAMRPEEQPPIPPFSVRIRRGVATYEQLDVPIRNVVIRSRGTVDLVRSQLDIVTLIPTLGASPSLLERVNRGVGETIRRLLPGFLNEVTSIPVRSHGPLASPRQELDLAGIIADLQKKLTNPDRVIQGIGGVLDNLPGRRPPAPPPPPPAPPAPTPPTPPATPPSAPPSPGAPE
jgi:hypothetical protein